MDPKAKVPAGTRVGDSNDSRRLRFTLSDDVLMEIHLWLPAKSVARFKSVCKRWLSLFSSDRFCRLHTLHRPKPRPSLMLKTADSQFFYFDPISNGEKLMIPYSFSVPNPIVDCSCNGLMLLRTDYKEQSFYVYNPTTKHSRKISVTDTHSDDGPYIVALALAFDPSESPHYKVVCIRSTTDDDDTDPYQIHTYLIEVYDSESHTWKQSLGPFTFPRILFIHQGGVYWNGSIYWMILDEIGYYHIGKNEFKTLSHPNYPQIMYQGVTPICTTYLQEANGHLYHSQLVTQGNCQIISLFELQMDERWRFKYHRVISCDQRTSSFFSYAHQLRFIKGSYDTETCGVVSHISGKISLYSFLDGSCKLLIDFKGEPFHGKDSKLVGYEFGECLALV